VWGAGRVALLSVSPGRRGYLFVSARVASRRRVHTCTDRTLKSELSSVHETMVDARHNNIPTFSVHVITITAPPVWALSNENTNVRSVLPRRVRQSQAGEARQAARQATGHCSTPPPQRHNAPRRSRITATATALHIVLNIHQCPHGDGGLHDWLTIHSA
jgi:hypothetical protein